MPVIVEKTQVPATTQVIKNKWFAGSDSFTDMARTSRQPQ